MKRVLFLRGGLLCLLEQQFVCFSQKMLTSSSTFSLVLVGVKSRPEGASRQFGERFKTPEADLRGHAPQCEHFLLVLEAIGFLRKPVGCAHLLCQSVKGSAVETVTRAEHCFGDGQPMIAKKFSFCVKYFEIRCGVPPLLSEQGCSTSCTDPESF